MMKANKGSRRSTLKLLKERLEQKQVSLRNTLQVELNGLACDVGDDLERVYEETNSQLATAEAKELSQINAALERCGKRKYGVCEVCEENISLARLEALPYATRCIRCQQKWEQNPDVREELSPAKLNWADNEQEAV